MTIPEANKFGVVCVVSDTLRRLPAKDLLTYGYTAGEVNEYKHIRQDPFNIEVNELGGQIIVIQLHYPFLRWYQLMDGSYYFYHAKDRDTDLYRDRFIKLMQLENTVVLPAIYEMVPGEVRTIKCPFYAFMNPMTTVLFQNRFTLGTETSFYYPVTTNAFLATSSAVTFRTVGKENEMELICTDLPPKTVELDSLGRIIIREIPKAGEAGAEITREDVVKEDDIQDDSKALVRYTAKWVKEDFTFDENPGNDPRKITPSIEALETAQFRYASAGNVLGMLRPSSAQSSPVPPPSESDDKWYTEESVLLEELKLANPEFLSEELAETRPQSIEGVAEGRTDIPPVFPGDIGRIWVPRVVEESMEPEPSEPPTPSDPVLTKITITPPGRITLKQGATQQFNAVVTGSGDFVRTVTWSVEGGTSNTSIDKTGFLTVSANQPPYVYENNAFNLNKKRYITVRAVSTADSSKSATAEAEIAPVPEEVGSGRDTDTDKLAPEFKQYALAIIDIVRQFNWEYRIVETFRVQAIQDAYWARGRPEIADIDEVCEMYRKVGIDPAEVTSAQNTWTPHSKHQDGLAIDIALLTDDRKDILPGSHARWADLGMWGKSVAPSEALEWGGDWPPNRYDPEHFELKG